MRSNTCIASPCERGRADSGCSTSHRQRTCFHSSGNFCNNINQGVVTSPYNQQSTVTNSLGYPICNGRGTATHLSTALCSATSMAGCESMHQQIAAILWQSTVRVGTATHLSTALCSAMSMAGTTHNTSTSTESTVGRGRCHTYLSTALCSAMSMAGPTRLYSGTDHAGTLLGSSG
jgi:hypothetical protein